MPKVQKTWTVQLLQAQQLELFAAHTGTPASSLVGAALGGLIRAYAAQGAPALRQALATLERQDEGQRALHEEAQRLIPHLPALPGVPARGPRAGGRGPP